MRILITGGAGFIGSNLAKFLIELGHSVIVVDDMSSGKKENISQLNLEAFHHCKVQNFDFQTLDGVDSVVHLAAQASVPYSISNFYESSINNLDSSLKIIEYCSKNNISLVYASSSAIYGNLPFGDDSSESKDLLSPYAVDKFLLEEYAKLAYNCYQLSSIGLRFFNVYGQNQDSSNPYSGVISIFIDRALKNLPININGGDQTRDFVYVDDVCEVINKSILLMQDRAIADHVNVLTGRELSISELALIIKEKLNSDSTIEYLPYIKGDPLKSMGDTQKIRNLYSIDLDGFMEIEQGLNKTIEYYRDSLIA